MKRPSAINYVLGNPASLAVLCGLTVYLVFEWWAGQVSGFFALVSLLASGSAMNANGRLTRYADWKREWDAMGGERSGPSFSLSKKWARWIFGIPAWVLCAYLARNVGNDPAMKFAASLFWLATLIGIVGALVQWFRARKRSAVPTASKDVPVTLCIGLPARWSPDLQHAYRALPGYCLPLLQRSQVDGR